MSKQKRKLTAAEKAEKKRRRIEYKRIFINEKHKRVKLPPTIKVWMLMNSFEEMQNQYGYTKMK
jgi:hypothetical protein